MLPDLQPTTIRTLFTRFFRDLTDIEQLHMPSPSDVLNSLGRPAMREQLPEICNFLVVILFLVAMINDPGPRTLPMFLEVKNAVYIDLKNQLLKVLPKPSLDKPSVHRKPPPYQRLSPNGLYYGSSSGSQKSYKTTPPTILDPPLPYVHTKSVHSQGGDDDDDDDDDDDFIPPDSYLDAKSVGSLGSISETPSQKAALDEIEEMQRGEYHAQQMANGKYRKSSNASLKSQHSSVRHMRSEDYKRYHASPKIRSNVSGDKLQWDGHRSTYTSFSADLEGTMLRLGAGYMVDRMVMEQYEKKGMDFIKDDAFWTEFGISVKQF